MKNDEFEKKNVGGVSEHNKNKNSVDLLQKMKMKKNDG